MAPQRTMTVALFVPCYVDQFYPQVAIATLQLLEKHGAQVHFPKKQTCCGQPMANSGFEHMTGGCNRNFLDAFQGYEYIVCPSGSCALHIKQHLIVPGKEAACAEVSNRVYELTEFLTDIMMVENITARFPFRVGLHQSCHGQRGLHLSQMSELVAPAFSKPETLLRMVEGLELVQLDRVDECCGFGGSFCVAEEAVSARMGQDRIADHLRNGAQVITGGDMSCLMHLEGILRRKKSEVQVKHIAEILNAE